MERGRYTEEELANIKWFPAAKNAYDKGNVDLAKNIQEVSEDAHHRGFQMLSRAENQTLARRIRGLVEFIIATDGVQDIIISENKNILVRMKGVMSENVTLDKWDEETFNYFVWEISNESVRKDMEIRKKLTILRNRAKGESIDYHGWLNKNTVSDLLESNKMSYDYSVGIGKKTLRIHMLSSYNAGIPDHQDITMSIRVNDTEIPSWDRLNLPELFKGVTKLRSGLVLVAGHVGAGKTTTAASAINTLNLAGDRMMMVLTIEDPIEYIYKSETVHFIQRNIGNNTPSFGKATDDAMRENADIVLIGELRSPEEMDNALRLAEIGKLVIATIHSNSVADTPERIINSFPGDVQGNIRARLKENVVCIMHQNLERVGDVQFPIVEGFKVDNQYDQTVIREAFKDRTSMAGFMQTAEYDWVINHRKAFKELEEKGVFEELVKEGKIKDIEEAKSALVPDY